VGEAIMKVPSGCNRPREAADASLGLDFHFENARLWITLGALAYTREHRDIAIKQHGCKETEKETAPDYSTT
jgi:hypothetical protein